MDRRIQNEPLDFLCKGILTLSTPEECRRFLEDLCSQSELQEMSRRLQAAQMLKSGYIYSEIALQTGLSTATISRVNRCLKYGEDGYITVLDRMEKAAKRR